MNPVLRNRLTPIRITAENFDSFAKWTTIKHMLESGSPFVECWGFVDKDSNRIGREFLIKKGGTDGSCKIRSIDAYLCGVEIYESCRGNEYAGEMITWLFTRLHEEGIDDLYLSVKKNNYPALRAYTKLGFERVRSMFTVSLPKLSIPARTL